MNFIRSNKMSIIYYVLHNKKYMRSDINLYNNS